MMEDATPSKRTWFAKRNWWKIGFWAMVVLFEGAREWTVIEAYEPTKVATLADVSTFGDWTRASGRWTRIDGGGAMVPGATLIECNREKGECVEATASAFNDYLSEPTVDTYGATFFPAAINYENDDPVCAHYSVRIDLKLKKVFAVRERKSLPQNEMCKNLERKIEMTLANGYQADEQPFKGHFVPLIRSIVWLLSLT